MDKIDFVQKKQMVLDSGLAFPSKQTASPHRCNEELCWDLWSTSDISDMITSAMFLLQPTR